MDPTFHLPTAGQRSPDFSQLHDFTTPDWSDLGAPGQQLRNNISIKGENETQFVILLACLSFVENRKIWNNKNTFTTSKVPTRHTHITLCSSECWAVFVKKSFHSALWYKYNFVYNYKSQYTFFLLFILVTLFIMNKKHLRSFINKRQMRQWFFFISKYFVIYVNDKTEIWFFIVNITF